MLGSCCEARIDQLLVCSALLCLRLDTLTLTSALACDSSTPALAYPRHFLHHLHTGSSLFIHLCPPSYGPFRHILPSLPLASSPTSLTSIAFCLTLVLTLLLSFYTLVYHMAATVRQPKPTKKGFPGDNPSTRFVPPYSSSLLH